MHAYAHGNIAHPETQSNRRAPPALCSHVERPEQLGASVSQRLDLLPRAADGKRGKRKGRERERVQCIVGDTRGRIKEGDSDGSE